MRRQPCQHINSKTTSKKTWSAAIETFLHLLRPTIRTVSQIDQKGDTAHYVVCAGVFLAWPWLKNVLGRGCHPGSTKLEHAHPPEDGQRINLGAAFCIFCQVVIRCWHSWSLAETTRFFRAHTVIRVLLTRNHPSMFWPLYISWNMGF